MTPGRNINSGRGAGKVKKPCGINNKNKTCNIPLSRVKNFFQNRQSTNPNESFTSTSSFGSDINGTLVEATTELPQMMSVLESRKKALDERRTQIQNISDEQLRTVLLNMVDDMQNVVDDGENILRCHNEVINKQNEDSETIQINRKSINNLTKGVGKLTDGINDVNNRVQSLEVSKNCAYDSHFINIVFVDSSDADGIENGTLGPKQKMNELLSEMKIVPPSDIIDSYLLTVPRFVKGKKKQIKMLKSRFSNALSAGRILSQIIKHNMSLKEAGKQNDIKYYAEIPASKDVWKLKRICYELKNEGTFVNVRCSDRGILVTYKVKDRNDDTKEFSKTSTVTSENDIDELRKILKVNDAYIPVAVKFNDEFWNKKKNPEMTQKRIREDDDNNEPNISKRVPSTSTQKF